MKPEQGQHDSGNSAGHPDQITGCPLRRRYFVRISTLNIASLSVELHANFIWHSTWRCLAHRKSHRHHDVLYASEPEKGAASGVPGVNSQKSPTHHVPARNSDVLVWHATHGLVPGAGTVTGISANC